MFSYRPNNINSCTQQLNIRNKSKYNWKFEEKNWSPISLITRPTLPNIFPICIPYHNRIPYFTSHTKPLYAAHALIFLQKLSNPKTLRIQHSGCYSSVSFFFCSIRGIRMVTDHLWLRFEEWWVNGARFCSKGAMYTWVLTPIRKVWLGAGPRMIVRGFLADRVVVLAWVEAGLVGVVSSWVLSWFKEAVERCLERGILGRQKWRLHFFLSLIRSLKTCTRLGRTGSGSWLRWWWLCFNSWAFLWTIFRFEGWGLSLVRSGLRTWAFHSHLLLE